MAASMKRLGEILVEDKIISNEDLWFALKIQKERKQPLGQILIDEGFVTERQVIEVLEQQYGIPKIELKSFQIDPSVPNMISARMARRYNLIPVKVEGNLLSVAMADPLNLFAMDDMKLATGMDIEPLLAPEKDVRIAIEQYYKKRVADDAVSEFSTAFDFREEFLEEDIRAMTDISNAPVVKLIDTIILQAADAKVSDIHIEPLEQDVRVRFRIDGDLMEHMVLKKRSLTAIITRIKIMGYMDIAETRIPQDGRVDMDYDGRKIDLRISVMPTVHGEKAVLRILDRGSKMLTLTELGMSEDMLKIYRKLAMVPHGILLVTGPTGSGKSTSLYATLMEINDVKKNIITVEDPVEYRLSGINQTQVNIKAGMTFSASLRSILRQDPDIIMIGEIRDADTAQIAVRAAITGHLVLSTLHTNDTASSVARLVNMGTESYLLSSALTGIVAQRLVRKICNNCKTEYDITDHEARYLRSDKKHLYKGAGCNLCNHTGYRGRTAIYEILPVTKDIRQMIDEKKGTDAIKDQAIKDGMLTLFESCRELVVNGVTTVEELYRMTNTSD